jgi:hypothetical protein
MKDYAAIGTRSVSQMGLFYERAAAPTRDDIKGAILDALDTQPPASSEEREGEAEARTSEIAPAGYAKFNTGRFVGALVIFALIVVGAIVCEATDLNDSSKALWGFGATIFGVVVGFLAGEKTAT